MAAPRFDIDLPRMMRGSSDTWDKGAAGVVLRDDAFAASQESAVKRWTGAEWAPAQVKRWTGAEWAPAQVKRWTGAEWVGV